VNIKEAFIKLKLYFERGRVYLGIVSFSGTAFMVITQLKILGLSIDITNYTAIVLAIAVVGTIALGFFEVKLKFFSKDLEVRGMKNPLWHKLYAQLDRIENKQKELEKKIDL